MMAGMADNRLKEKCDPQLKAALNICHKNKQKSFHRANDELCAAELSCHVKSH